MAVVTFDEVRVAHADDPSVEVVSAIKGDYQAPRTVTGDVRDLGSRRVIVVRDDPRTDLSVSLPLVDRADLHLLELWVGEPVMVRDPARPEGRLTYGVYFTLDVTEIDGNEEVAVSFQLSQVTYDDAI